ncbi:hypothetical protein MVES_000574 [Malassezia vespertilionis]|uniref:VLRF1 domain-containing protein n=2 Tax=Malassezia vespertilionis TaxID=2020962 RepID=A0A2N1JHB9_9BASI|nr:hypothetical protein MVES_000574 [Malassezia vespertilionis]
MTNAIPKERHAFLSAPLYAFDLPAGLVPNVHIRSTEDEAYGEVHANDKADSGERVATGTSRAGFAPACTLCPGSVPFPSLCEQRAHFRSLWHRYNLVLKQRGANPPSAPGALHFVTHAELDTLAADAEADMEAAEKEDEEVDTLSALIARLQVNAAPDADDHSTSAKNVYDALRSPLVWFESKPDAAPEMRLANTQLGIYRDVLLASGGLREHASALSALATLQTPPITCRPVKGGWTGKHLQGTRGVGRAIQMQVLDGDGLLPNLDHGDLYDLSDTDESSASDTSADDEAPAEHAPAQTLPPLRLWTFIMQGGGHFAAAVVALNIYSPQRSERARAKGSRVERGIVVLAHKTFHRYTTRRKQGGAQSAQDASGKHAKSAGANLRRYGEAQLRHDIHSLLGRPGWRALIAKSEQVWVRTSMRAANGVLWHWPGSQTSPLDAPYRDRKLSHIPIPTKRPTLGEIMRCFFELTRVKVAHLTPEQLAAQDDAEREAIARALRADAAGHLPPPPPPTTRPRKSKPDRVEAKRHERWERLVAMVRKGKLDTLAQFLARHEEDLLVAPDGRAAIDAPLPDWWQRANKHAKPVPGTLLQLAAAADQPEIVQYLLVERRADPTLPVPQNDDTSKAALRTAYDLCGTKASRAVFRRLMAEQPFWWDWGGMEQGGARVPSALTPAMQEAQASKTRSRRNAMREKMRERDEAKAPSVPEPAPAPAPALPWHATQKPGASVSDAGLSEEVKMRIEREKRARAAEARIQALRK